jgi:uncharacterized protein YyaL (SSP411 family)
MRVCQDFTGHGGWPLTILMTPEQKPFLAGMYFPKHSGPNAVGCIELLTLVKEHWQNAREKLLQTAEELVRTLKTESSPPESASPEDLIAQLVRQSKRVFDGQYGGFGAAPKFPMPCTLLFLLTYARLAEDEEALRMVEKTLRQMYQGGLFDHIGFGFCRYATDRRWLAPHFEKMLYDNALLTLVYAQAYQQTRNERYKVVAEKTAAYVLRELSGPDGGFFCAQDADSEGEEGKYYLFRPAEIVGLLGKEDGQAFNAYFDITEKGNFQGANIPNLLATAAETERFEAFLPEIYAYRKNRTALHRDDKVLTSWNALMITALAGAYRILGDEKYLAAAQKSLRFIETNLAEGENLFASYRDGQRGADGFLDDYAFLILALLQMYGATLDKSYLARALSLLEKAVTDFFDEQRGGFYLYGKNSEKLILQPKETNDGAVPSGNSVMAYNLLIVAKLVKSERLEGLAARQRRFMAAKARGQELGHSAFMLSMLLDRYPLREIVCVLKSPEDISRIKGKLPPDALVTVLEEPTKEYPLLNAQMTFYSCEKGACLPPVNELGAEIPSQFRR